ncbi:MAG: 4a-hydroxytetrahydrobiopterin dehydratase [Ferruginibacter sp.]
MPVKKLLKKEIDVILKGLVGWKFLNNGIKKDFLFKDFNEAFAFLTRIAMLSEKMDHHAEWSGVYNKVHIRLSTHDAGGVTQKDIDMATSIEKYL